MTLERIELGVIADDLTGGAKVASLLETAGVRCPLLTSNLALESLTGNEQAVVIGRKLLALPAKEAVADACKTAESLLAKGVRQIYYKYSALFSSTARGNIGPVAEALMTVTKADQVLFCPARPERNATVYQGRLFLGQNMLHETPRRLDPVTPMTNSNLVEVLQSQSQVNVGLLPLNTLRAGETVARSYLSEQLAADVKFFIVDAIEDSDLARVAELAHDTPLTTGADDFPVALAHHWQDRGHIAPGQSLLPPAPGHTALISGSCTPKSLRQLARFEQHYPVFRIDLLRSVKQAETEDEIAEWAAKHITQGPIGVATSANHDVVARAQSKLGREGASSLAENILSRVARRLHALGARKFVLAGGETSGKVLEALGAGRMDVAVHDDLQGGYCHIGGEDPIALVLKAGSTGDEDFYQTALTRLQKADTTSN